MAKSSQGLSLNKQAFLRDTKAHQQNAHQLSAEEVSVLVPYFNKKHAIKIYLNGETSEGRNKIEAKKKLLQQQLEKFKDSKQKYAAYLQYFLFSKGTPGMVDICGLGVDNTFCITDSTYFELHNIHNACLSIVKDKYTIENNKKIKISANHISTVNEECKQNQAIRSALDKKINELVQQLEDKILDIALTADESIEEILSIQENIDAKQAVGYVFTNNHAILDDHFEVVIITKDKLIKPVHWPGDDKIPIEIKYNRSDRKEEKQPPLEIQFYLQNFPFTDAGKGTHPQGDRKSCGVLGLLYLKELLKNNAKNLNEDACCYSELHAGFNLNCFIPSPHLLRYSQSFSYNRKFSEQVQKLNTLSLPFRQKWLAEYENVTSKRDQMSIINYNGKPENLYLFYRGHKMKKQAELLLEKKQFLQELESYKTKRERKGIDFYGIFGKLKGMSCAVKVNAVNKLLTLLKGNPLVAPFSRIDIDALRDKSLGDIVRKYEHLLPAKFIEAEGSEHFPDVFFRK